MCLRVKQMRLSLSFFSGLCQLLAQKKGEVIIFGDFNINLLEFSNERRKLLNIARECILTQCMKVPTRIASRRENK